MGTFLSLIHIVLSILLIVVVLLQHRKEGGFGGAFGGSTQAETANQWQRFTGLTKITIVLAALFMLNALVLAIIR